MPPKRRNPEQAGGYPGAQPERSVADIASTHNMSLEEARGTQLLPQTWMARMTYADAEGLRDIATEAQTHIAQYEATYGPHQDWDDMRIVTAHALLALHAWDEAAELLVGVSDIAAMAKRLIAFLMDGLRAGAYTDQETIQINWLIQNAFIAHGRELEFMRAGRNVVIQFGPDPMSNAGAFADAAVEKAAGESVDPVADWADIERQQHPRAMWDEIVTIIHDDSLWPEDTDLTRRRVIAGHFAERQHNILAPKVARKEIENLKTDLKDLEAALPGAVWDHFRFLTALSLFDVGEPNFGRGMARAMTDETMIGTVCFALAKSGRDREALATAYEIRTPQLFAKVVYTAEWADRAPIDALLEDMTHVTPTTRRKYDPVMRLGVAQGLAELFETRAQEAVAAEDETSAADWRTRAQTMQARASLLQWQIDRRYISAPGKKDKNK
jgi:hypothetical protein